MAKNRRRARKDSYLAKRKEKNKRFLKAIAGLIVISSLGFFYINSSMNKENAKMNQDILSSQKKLEDIKGEIDELKEDYEMRNTDLFKEKVAKEKLGMVKKEEIEDKNSEENAVIKPINGEGQSAANGEDNINPEDNTSSDLGQNQVDAANENNPQTDPDTNANGR